MNAPLNHWTALEIQHMRAALERWRAPLRRFQRLLRRTGLPRHAREAALRLARHALPTSAPIHDGHALEINQVSAALPLHDGPVRALLLENRRALLRERDAVLRARTCGPLSALPPLPPCPERQLLEDLR